MSIKSDVNINWGDWLVGISVGRNGFCVYVGPLTVEVYGHDAEAEKRIRQELDKDDVESGFSVFLGEALALEAAKRNYECPCPECQAARRVH